MWKQQTLRLPAYARGWHLITNRVLDSMPTLERCQTGMLHVFLMHTSASLGLNENADPDVRTDLEMAINHAVPEDLPYIHTLEGPDDMPAHVKSALLGNSLVLPVGDGRLRLGTWQGIYLVEHRNRASGRTLTLTLHGTMEA